MKESLLDFINIWNKSRPKHFAIVDCEGQVTYSQLYNNIVKLQNLFLKYGLIPGNTVILRANKTAMFVSIFLALSGLGISVACVSKSLGNMDYNQLILKTNATHMIFLPELNYSQNRFNLNDFTIKSLINNSSITIINDINESSSSNYIINYENKYKTYLNITTGTTGQFKIVEFYSWQIVQNAQAFNKVFPLRENSAFLSMFLDGVHPHDLFARNIVSGTTCVLYNNNILLNFKKYAKEHNIDQMLSFPNIYKFIIEKDIDLPNLNYFFVTGEKINYTLRYEFLKKYKCPLIPVWGSTETCGVAIYTPSNKIDEEDNILGIPFENYEIKIDTVNHELLIRGLCCGMNYRNDKTSLVDKEGFIHTGDIVKRVDNLLYFVGRTNSVVKISGRKISLSLVEDLLNKKFKIDFLVNLLDDEAIEIRYEIHKGFDFDEKEMLLLVRKIFMKLINYIPKIIIKKVKYFDYNISGKTKRG